MRRNHMFLIVAPFIVSGVVAADPPSSAPPPQETDASHPPLKLKLLRSSDKSDGDTLDLAVLRGQVVVLEFWGTYCAPCIAAIPHWNKLVDQYADTSVRFISVSDEDRKTVERFLRRRPIKGVIAIDPERAAFEAFHITGVPTTIILDREGNTIGAIAPWQLTAELLNLILAGKPVDLPSIGDAERTPLPPRSTAPPPLFAIRITPSAEREFGGVSSRPGEVDAKGWTLRQAIAYCVGLDARRLDMSDAITDTRLDIYIRVPPQHTSAIREVMLDALQTTFDIRVEQVTREVDAYRMTMPNGPGPALLPTAARDGSAYSSVSAGMLSGVNQSMQQVARQLEAALGVPVFDETGVGDRFDYNLHFEDGNAASLLSEVRAQLGLHLEKTRRSVPSVVVRPRS